MWLYFQANHPRHSQLVDKGEREKKNLFRNTMEWRPWAFPHPGLVALEAPGETPGLCTMSCSPSSLQRHSTISLEMECALFGKVKQRKSFLLSVIGLLLPPQIRIAI